MRSLPFFLLALPGLLALPAHGQEATPEEAAAKKPLSAPLRVERGSGQLALVVPRAEVLHFNARRGGGGSNMGTAVFRSAVTGPPPGRRSGPAAPEEAGHEIATLTIDVEASYSFYSIDAVLQTRVLPQEWPRIINRYVRVGKKPRRREVLIGVREGEPAVCYRKDTEDGAPKGMRVWRDDRYREVPTDVLDTVSALHLARTMVVEGQRVARFPMIDRLQLWQMRARRGQEKRVKTPAGTFDAVEVTLDPQPWPGEERDKDGDRVEFKGLFGMKGAIRVWMDKRTGTPVRIEGEVPVGPMDFDLVLELARHEGTPADFRAVEKRTGN